LAGFTTATNFPTVSAYQTSLHGSQDAFAAKLNSSGNTLTLSTYLGGNSSDAALAVALDGSDNLYLTGSTGSSDFPRVNAVQSSFGGGGSDAFVTKTPAAGGANLSFSSFLGGSGADQ